MAGAPENEGKIDYQIYFRMGVHEIKRTLVVRWYISAVETRSVCYELIDSIDF